MSTTPALACAAYVRTSTDDQQSPEDSKRWQLDTARRLVQGAGGEIVAVYHDVDVTRERPWARRPEAARLLADAAIPDRGWTALVIAEPQRAFSGGQFQLVFPQLTHYGVELWVPELGGRIDPDSEGHEMLMSLFGGLSRAERRRLQIRTRNAMFAHGAAGRWLGGRPNYGYRIVDTDLPHPQRQKAAAGIRLRVLEPDPDTAPIVHRIFEMFDNRIGYRTIATILEREGIPSPGEVGPTRHPRSAGVWSGSAVRAILVNPRYLGHQVVGRQRRRDELVEPTNPAAGTASKQRWQAPDQWVTSDEPAWPALVERDLWERVNARVRNNRGPHRRPPRAKPGVYVLAGLIRCSVCGRSMHGATMKGKAYYRCNRQRPDYAETGHPRSTAIREERILTALDTWLNRLTDAEHRASTLAAVLGAEADPEPDTPEVRAARRAVRRAARRARPCARRRPRRHGPRPRGRHHQADPTRARRRPQHPRRLECRRRRHPAATEPRRAHRRPRPGRQHRRAPAAAERETRAQLYQALDLDLHLDPVGDPPTLEVRLQLCGGGGRI